MQMSPSQGLELFSLGALIMTLSDWLMIIAVLLAPVIALQLQRWIEDYRRKKDRKEWIFKTLMATRAETLSRDHVNALNMIDIEYHADNKGINIVRKWREYLDHLDNYPKEGTEDQRDRWGDKKGEILADILMEMSIYLGYRFEKLTIKKAIYVPQAYSDIEFEQTAIRRGVLDILLGRKPIPIEVASIPLSEDTLREQADLRRLMLEQYKGNISLRVRIDHDS